jgi:hypothetical protein
VKLHARGNRISDKGEKVALALLKRHGPDGRCDPTQATLAADAGCKERTVRRANDRLLELKLLTWQTRIVRDGWRVSQTSNAYQLLPSEVVHIPATPPNPCGGQNVRQTSSLDKSRELLSLPTASAREVATAKAALAERRRVMEARLLNKGLKKGVATRATG